MDTQITLREGIAVFHKRNSKYFSKRTYSEKGKKFLDAHDIAHVVFGCDTTLYGEGMVKIWTTFGTNLGFWEVTTGYNEVSAFELFKKYSIQHILKNILKLLSSIPKAIIHARKMRKKWPFYNYDPYMDIPISEIRKRFNINTF